MPYIVNNNPNPKDELLKAVLSALLPYGMGALMPGSIPNPGYGQTGSPGTTFSRAGQQANPLAPPSTAQYQAPQQGAPYANKPMLNTQQFSGLQQNQAYQKNAQDMANSQRMSDFWSNLGTQAGNSAPTQPGMAGGLESTIQELYAKHKAGDTTATMKLLQLKQLLESQ